MPSIEAKVARFLGRFRGSVSRLALAVALTTAAPAQTTTWLGNTAAWNTLGNWTNGVPGATTTVVFNAPTPNSPTLSGTVSTGSILFMGNANQNISGFSLLSTTNIDNQGDYVASFTGLNVALHNGSVVRASNVNGGGILVNSGVNATLTSQLTFDTVNSANTITLVNGIISISLHTLNKTGAGAFYMQGANPASQVNLNGGVYNVSADSGLGRASASSILFNGGTLQFGGDFTTSATRDMILNVDGVFDTNGRNDTIANVISDGGGNGLFKIGAGTLTLTGTNSYTGITTISAGTLALSGAGSIVPTYGGVHNDGTFDISATTNGASINTLSGGGRVNLGAQTLTLTNAADTFSGFIEGAGGLTLAGGTEILTGANTYTGGTTISAGASLQLGNGGTTGSITGDVANEGELVFNRSNPMTFAGAISGGGTVNQAGTGTTILTGNSTYTGATYISAGELRVASGGKVNGTTFTSFDAGSFTVTGAGSAFTTSGDLVAGRGTGPVVLTVADGGQLTTGRSFIGERGGNTTATALTALVTGPGSVWDTGGSFFLGADTGSPVSLTISNGGVMRAQSNAANSIIGYSGAASATVTGANSQLVEGGSAALIIGGTAGGAGTLTIENGGLVIAPGVVIGVYDANTSGILNVNGTAGAQGVLQTSGLYKDMGSAAVSFDGGILRATAGNDAFISGFASGEFILQTGGMGIDTNGFTDTVLSGLQGGGMLTKLNAGTLILAAENSYTGGTTISAGTLQLGNGGTAGSIVGDVTNNGTLAFNRSDTMNFGGIISGSGSVSQIGTGTTVLTANNTYTGGTTIAAGTLQLGNGGTAGSIVGDVTNNGTLAFNRSDTINFGGIISGSGSVSQIGAGTTVLTANNTYTGGTTISAGTLQLGNGGTTGSIVGDVANNGTLAFNRSDTVTFGRTISGSGSVSQIGAGTTIFTANNTYTGGTTISAGTLQLGNGGTAGNIVGDVTNNGMLAFNRSDAVTFGGIISGSGSVSQIGTGTTMLTANNTYTGGTTISGGTLQLGNGGTSGVVNGNVTNNGTLAFNRSDTVTFGGTISGSGSVYQLGAGTTTLTANNTYSGGTTISAGTLRGSASSFGTGPIQNQAALVIDQPADAAFVNAIQGTGSFTKTGIGRLNYTGTGALTGPTTIAAGTLSMNGSLAFSTATVLSSGTLGGNGTIGAATVLSGGTVAPGNSLGTLHVNGGFTQAAGSNYQVEVNPNSNASDLISVNGTAMLASGAALNVSKSEPGNYRQGAIYTVVDASDGRSGTYSLTGNTMSVSAFLGLRDTYDANHAYLTVVQTRDPAGAAQTSNQKAVASGLPTSSTVKDSILNSPTDTAARQGFDQLAGDSHAAVKGVLIADSRLVRDLTIDRVRDLFGFCTSGRPGQRSREGERLDGACIPIRARQLVWAQGFGAWGHTGGDGNSGRVGRSTGGVLGGLDLPVARDWRLGGFLGYSHSNLTQNSGVASADINNYHFGLYGGTQRGSLGLRFGTAYTMHEIQTGRLVSLPNFSEQLSAGYRGRTIQGYAEAGYRIDGERISVEPFAGIAYVTLHTNGITEIGGDAALTALAADRNNTFSTFGVRPSGNLALGAAHLTLRGLIGWRHAFGSVIPASAFTFVQGGGAFDVEGVPLARDTGVLELGLDFKVSRDVILGFTYGTQTANRNLDQSVRANITMSF